MAPGEVRIVENLHVPKHLRQYIAADPEEEAGWSPGPDTISFEEFVRQAQSEAAESDSEDRENQEQAGSSPLIELPPPPPEPTFHHVRPGPGTGQPWLYPDITNLVCTGMSITDVEVLTRQREAKKKLKNSQVQKREVKGQVFVIDTYSWDDGHQKDFTRDHVSVYVPLRRDLLSECGLSKDMVNVVFGPRSFHLTVSLPNANSMTLGYDKLANEIVPDESYFRVNPRSLKVTIKLRKRIVSNDGAPSQKWAGLGAGHYSVACNSNTQMMRRKLQSENPEMNHDLIDISHIRNWEGPPKYSWDNDN